MEQSFHPDFIARYTPLFNEKEFATFLEYCTKPLRKALRVNTLRISLEDFEKRAKKNNWKLEKIPYVDCGYFIDRENHSIPLGKSLEYFAGLFYIQETSSMIPPMVLNPQKGDIILDVSAAPGSKTTQMSIMMENDGLVIGNDIVPTRIKALKTNINYQGIISAGTSKLDGRDFGRYFNETFDKILLDAPCSGEGTMRKDKINWSLPVILELSTLQKRLICSALQSLKIGGTLVYSTCTMTPEEDEVILDYIKSQFGDSVKIIDWKLPGLKSTPGMTQWQGKEFHPEVANGQKIWPHINDTEGFFIAKVVKVDSTKNDTILEYYTRKNEEKTLKGKELKVLFSAIKKQFGIDPKAFANYIILKKGSSLQIRTKESNAFSSLPNIQNIGINFGEEIKNKFCFNFYSGQTFGKHFTKNIVILESSERAENFAKGKDIELTEQEKNTCLEGQVLVKYDNIVLGTSLLQKGGKLKNQVPREHIKL